MNAVLDHYLFVKAKRNVLKKRMRATAVTYAGGS